MDVSDEVVEFAREVRSLDSGGKYEAADIVIADRAKQRRQTRPVRIRSRSTEKDAYRVRTRRVESAWSEQVLSSTSAALIGPSGIRFALTREED